MIEEANKTKAGFLSGNQLKIMAALFMIVDHVGVLFFPSITSPMMWTRCVGRLAFPMFAFFIAEGCRYTKDRARYLGIILLMGIVFHLVYYYFMNDNMLNVFLSFSFAIALIYLWQNFISACKAKRIDGAVLGFVLLFGYAFLVYRISKIIHIDYYFGGVLLPWLVYLTKKKWLRLFFFALGITLVAVFMGKFWTVEAWGLLAVPVMALYNESRGKMRMKYFFYLFYPIHLVALYGISLLVAGGVQ